MESPSALDTYDGDTRVPCVGGVVFDQGRVLLVRRGHEPSAGLWSVPGGRREPGESDHAATVREVWEETGLWVEVDRLAGAVERPGPGGVVYLIRDFCCHPAPGADPGGVRAGDDASEVGWFTPAQLRRLACTPGLVTTLETWGLLSSAPQPPAPGRPL